MRLVLKSALAALLVVSGAPAFAATVVTLAPTTGHPNLPVTVTGSGFANTEAVDIYIDTVDSLLAVSTATGTIRAAITIPAAAQPGLHYVTAIGRKSGDAAQKPFTVSTSWAEDGFGAAHLAWNQYENTLSPSVIPSLELQWTAPESPDYGTPAVVGGRIYVGSGNGTGVYALNATTGAIVWHQTTAAAEPFFASAAVAGGMIYIQGDTGLLYAFNTSGTLQWSKQLGTSGLSGPVVVNGLIYVESGNSIYALTTSGNIQWSYVTGNAAEADAVAVGNGRVFATSTDGKVYAFDASTGTLIWSFSTGSSFVSTPAVANGIVYVGCENKIFYALRAASGTPIWSATTGSQIEGSPAVAGGVAYIASEDGNLYAYNALNGDSVWSVPITGSGSQVSIADGVIYVGDNAGNVYAFDAQYGQYLVGVATGGVVFGAPVVVNGTLYVASGDGNMYAFAPGGTGADGIRRATTPPALSSLHPDMQLVPVR
jgi:outer membrane protein assembly factor BamB